jgi:paraquat-inducible protein B
MKADETNVEDPRPRPVPMRVRRRRYFSIVWLVPLVAAAVAAYLVYQRTAAVGPLITIRFPNVEGLKAGQSPVKHRGVSVGEVTALTLSADMQTAEVKVRLAKSAAGLARQGSRFWIVRPEVGVRSITGLGTIISGPFIEVVPGSGPVTKVFEGIAVAPLRYGEEGLRIVLLSGANRSVRAGSPVYYRGIEVGVVQEQRLSKDARAIEFDVFIPKHYAPLVRAESQFWDASGVDVNLGLFRGAQVNIESLKSLVSGGIAFATPEPPGKPVADGTVFRLHTEPRKEWNEWSPAIELGPVPIGQ